MFDLLKKTYSSADDLLSVTCQLSFWFYTDSMLFVFSDALILDESGNEIFVCNSQQLSNLLIIFGQIKFENY